MKAIEKGLFSKAAKLFLATALVISLKPAWSMAESLAVKIDSTQSPVTFLAIGKPGFLRIKGEGTEVHGDLVWVDQSLRGEFKVPLAKLATGIDLRDQHMKEKYLEVGKFPEASFVLDPLKVNFQQPETLSFSGQLTLKGVTKSIQGKLNTAPSGEKIEGEAEFTISLTDFGVEIPSHLGIKVAETVEIKVKLQGVKIASKPS